MSKIRFFQVIWNCILILSPSRIVLLLFINLRIPLLLILAQIFLNKDTSRRLLIIHVKLIFVVLLIQRHRLIRRHPRHRLPPISLILFKMNMLSRSLLPLILLLIRSLLQLILMLIRSLLLPLRLPRLVDLLPHQVSKLINLHLLLLNHPLILLFSARVWH